MTTNALTSKEKFIEDISTLVNAAIGVVIVRTREPYEVMTALREYSLSTKWQFNRWSITTGFLKYSMGDATAEPVKVDNTQPPGAAIKYVGDAQDGNNAKQIYAMMWSHFYSKRDNPMPEFIQHMADYTKLFANKTKRLIMVVPPEYQVPPELQDSVVIVDTDLPTQAELRELYDDVMEQINTLGKKAITYTEEEVDRITAAGAGMTLAEFDNTLSRALRKFRKELPDIAVDTFVREISKTKAEIVKRSEVLELMPLGNMDEVGGLENLKEWISLRRHAYDKAAREFGVDRPRGVALLGAPGCLSGDTVMLYNRGEHNGVREITLEKLYLKINGLGGGKPWDTALPTYLHSHEAETGKVMYNRVVTVIDAGVKSVVLLTTAGGRQLKLTSDHPVLTEDGYIPAGELKAGAEIIVRGNMKPSPKAVRHGRKPRVTVEGLKYYAAGWDKTVTEPTSGKQYFYKRQHRARLVVEAHLNKMTYDAYITALKNIPEAIKLQVLPADMIVHHMDENPMNDTLPNLQVMFKPEHDALHTDERNFNVEYTAVDTVEGVEAYGEERTYDVQMEVPNNNFTTADGLIVHNTGKSLCAKAIAHELGLPLIRFDISRIFGSLVGQSEGRVREALKLCDAMAPAVLLLDEVDKAFDVNSGGGDSGVGKRVLGAVLTHMQESDKDIFWVMTANRVGGLPPELLRKGRLDEVFSVTTPSEKEREAIFKIHLKKRKQNPDLKGLEKAVEASNRFVGAEIEAAVAEAVLHAYAKSKALTAEMLVEQFKDTKPLSEAHKEQFRMMEDWAADNAKSSSKEAKARTRERSRVADTSSRSSSSAVLTDDLDG